jgi:hypothetical protein
MYRNFVAKKILPVTALCLSVVLSQGVAMAQEVNVYSARKEALILPLLQKFEAETGIGFIYYHRRRSIAARQGCGSTAAGGQSGINRKNTR